MDFSNQSAAICNVEELEILLVLSVVAVHSFETSVNTSQTTRRHIPEVDNLYGLKWVVIMYNGECENLASKGNHYFCINSLKTKRRLLYLKTQSVPRSKHFSSPL